MPWELGAIAVFTMVTLASTASAQGPMAVVLFSAFGTAAMLVGAVQAMKLANRRAQRRIACGEYPEIASVHFDGALPSGSPGPRAEDGA